jgi:hypothetical protein
MAIIAVTIEKENKDVKTGISVTDLNGAAQIRAIVPNSLFAKNAPQLQPAMRIVSVNNVQCDGKTPTEVTQLIKDAEGSLVMLVDDQILASHQAAIAKATGIPAVVTATFVDDLAGADQAAPSGLEAGGVWGTAKYMGEKSKLTMCLLCICCFPFCVYVLCCPQDEKDAYRIAGKVSRVWTMSCGWCINFFCFLTALLYFPQQVYDADGKFLGNPVDTKFVPSRARA